MLIMKGNNLYLQDFYEKKLVLFFQFHLHFSGYFIKGAEMKTIIKLDYRQFIWHFSLAFLLKPQEGKYNLS